MPGLKMVTKFFALKNTSDVQYNRFIGYINTTIHIRDETILQYIDILQYLLQQYNTIRLKYQYIAYCNIL